MGGCAARFQRLAVVAAISLLLPAAAFSQPKSITILHTNDMHAAFIPHEALWVRQTPKPMIGGFSELSLAIDSVRRAKPLTLLLDAGDVMTGNPITEYVYKGAEGGALFEMMNRMAYEAWEIGNHDFDISQENLRKLTEIASFPTLCANIVDTLDRFPVNNKEFVILEKDGLKIGIIGIMSKDFYTLVNQNSTAGIKLLPPVETARRLAALLDSQTDLLIALTHEGVEDDSVLAMSVKGIDVIVGGHSHTRLRHPKKVNGVLIVQTGANCENLGVLDLKVEKHHIVSYDGNLVQLWYRPDRPKTDLSRFIDSIKANIDNDYAEVIGTLKQDWVRGRGGESAIGDFITDAQREAAKADVAFMNDHGIRKDMPAGPITKRDLFEILPFRNILTTFELTGKQLRTIVEYLIDSKAAIQTSGIQCEWTRNAQGQIEFTKFLVGGKPLDENKIYIGAASDYLMGEAQKYLDIEVSKLTYLNETVFTAVENKIRAEKTISSAPGRRISRVK
jgi:5'-nucleotidase/UDP-sugar diphosphatase